MGNVTTCEYEEENWPDKVTKIIGHAPFNYEATFTYDATTGDLLTTTDPLGRTITRTYYSRGIKDRLLRTETNYPGQTTEYDYDEFFYVKWIKDHLGRYHYFWYDQEGKIQKETDVYRRTTEYTYNDK